MIIAGPGCLLVPSCDDVSHCGIVTHLDFALRQHGVELFGDPAVGVGRDGSSEAEGFEGDASKGFGVGGAGNDDIGAGEDLAEVAAVTGEGEVVFEACFADGIVNFGQEVQFAGVGFADEEAVDGEAFGFEGGDDLDEIELSFPAGDAPGEGDEKFAGELGVFVLPAVEPCGVGAVGGVVLGGVDAAVNDGEFFLGDVGVVFEDVFADAVGNTDDALAAGHDFGVGVDGIETVHGGDETGSFGGVEFAPGEVGEPGGHAGTEVEDVGLFCFKDASEDFDLGEGTEAFFVNGKGDVPRAFRLELRDEATAVGNHEGFVSVLAEEFPEFKGAAFDATGVEFGKDLDDFHGRSIFLRRREALGRAARRPMVKPIRRSEG